MHLISGVQPLHQHLHAWAGSVFLALRIEMPAAPTFRMIEHPVHDAFHAVILAPIFRRHPVEQLLLLSAVVEAEGGKSHTELVMAARFKSAEPAFREFFHLFDYVLRTRFRLLLAVCFPRGCAALTLLGSASAAFR